MSYRGFGVVLAGKRVITVDGVNVAFCPRYCPEVTLRQMHEAEGGVPYTRPSRIYVGLTARFTLGSTPVLRFGFVGFAAGFLVGIRTGLERISGFVPDFVPKKSNESPLGATWGLFWPF